MKKALVYRSARNHPKTYKIMGPIAVGLEKIGYHVTFRESWHYPQGDESEADLLAIWGDFHGTEKIYADRIKFKRLLHIDNGYMARGHHRGYYSVTYGNKQILQELWHGPTPTPERFQQLNLPLNRWRKSGSRVLALGLSRKQCLNLGVDYPVINKELAELIRARTGMITVLREKKYDNGITPLATVLEEKWHSVVGFHTKGLIESLLAGIPIVALDPCAVHLMGRPTVAAMIPPYYPENRSDFFARLAYHQWTLDEIAAGDPWRKGCPLRVLGEIE